MVCDDRASEFLRDAIVNLLISHRLFPVEGYEFPQEQVAEFWKAAFAERGIQVFGEEEVPSGVHRLQVSFTLPDDPPNWMSEG